MNPLKYTLSEHHFQGVFLGERRLDVGVKKRTHGKMKTLLSASNLEWTLRDHHIFYKIIKEVDYKDNRSI